MSTSSSAIDAGQAYELLGTFLRIEHEHLKLALVGQAASAQQDGTTSATTGAAPRIIALISNIDGGAEQAALLLLRRSKRRPDRLRCITAVPLVKGFSGEATPQGEGEGAGLTRLKVSCGGERFEAVTEDQQGLEDLLKVSSQLAKASEEHQASSSSSKASHAWVNAYLRCPLRAAGAPIFSRFTSSSFAPSSPPADGSAGGSNGSSSAAEIPRPSSPGAEELSIAIGTFNVNEQPPSELGDLSSWLRPFSPAAQGASHHAHSHARAEAGPDGMLPPSLEGLEPDLLVVSLQEAQGGRAYLYHGPEVITSWREAIEKAMGPRRAEYALLASRQLVGIVLLMWVRHPLVPQISSLSTTSVGTGLGGFMANKGACAVRFKLGGKAYCFVASHLSAYDGPEARERRRWDYGEVLRRVRFEESGEVRNGEANVGATAEEAGSSMDAADRAAQIEERSAMPEDLQAGIDPSNGPVVQDGAAVNLDAQRRATTPQPPSVGILDSDVIFWAGDLNFRLVLPSAGEIKRLLARRQYRALLEFDELRLDIGDGKGEEEKRAAVREMKRDEAVASGDDDEEEEEGAEDERMHAQWLRRGAGQYERAFKGWNEALIDFPCTYKFVRGQNSYDGKRNPAWTDRVLWHEPQAGDVSAVRCTSYTASMINEVGVMSDHRPVCATFSVAIEGGSVRWAGEDEGLEGFVKAVGKGEGKRSLEAD